MQIDSRTLDGIPVVSLIGRFDAHTAESVQDELNRHIDSGQTKLAVDFSGVEYISSAGLRVMLAALKKINAENGKLHLFGMRSFVLEVFDIAGFTGLFKMFPDGTTALKMF